MAWPWAVATMAEVSRAAASHSRRLSCGTEPGESPRPPQALVGVLDQQIANGDTTSVGLDREPLGQFDRNDEAAPNIVVASQASSRASDKLPPLM